MALQAQPHKQQGMPWGSKQGLCPAEAGWVPGGGEGGSQSQAPSPAAAMHMMDGAARQPQMFPPSSSPVPRSLLAAGKEREAAG